MMTELYSFQSKMQDLCNCSTVVDKVSTSLCHYQNFGHDSRGLHSDVQK